MNYGFKPDKGEFWFDDPETGKSWDNRLWNDKGYLLTVDHLGRRTAEYVDENAARVNMNLYGEGGIYLRDDDTGEFFSPAVYPVGKKGDSYFCRHGQNKTEISGVFGDICSKITYSVLSDVPGETWNLLLENNGKKELNLSLFVSVVFDIGGFAMPFYYNPPTTSETKFVRESNAIICLNKNPFAPNDKASAFIASVDKIHAFDGNWEKFIGTFGSSARPKTVADKKDCSCSLATVRSRGGVLQIKRRLKPGEKHAFRFVLGFVKDEGEIVSFLNLARSEDENEQEKTVGAKLGVKCPEERMNGIFNYWAEKQTRFCLIGKKAVRDNMQLAVALLNFDAEIAKKTCEECLRHQYSDGHSVLLWFPVSDEKIYSDPPMWLIYGICEYVKETGDEAFLNEKISWSDGGEATVYEHIKRACEWYMRADGLGRHGLPKICYADWNDALNIPDDNAESVFMAMGICLVFEEASELARRVDDGEFAAVLDDWTALMNKTVNAVAWEEDKYVRAFSRYGIVGGNADKNGGNYYVNPQSFAILADIVPKDRLPVLLKKLDSIETDEGVPICCPPYRNYDKSVGRMSGMLPGVYENGGIYNHAGCFKVMADCKLKRTENAAKTLLKIIPDGEFNPSEKTTMEPYVFTNCYLKHPSVDMMAASSWQTGTSGWALRCFYEGILGLKRTYDGLTIDPCLPKGWENVECFRYYRGAKINVKYVNRGGSAVKLIVDGEPIEGNLLPAFETGSEHFVVAEIA